MPDPSIKFKLAPGATYPMRMTEGAACWDLFANEPAWFGPSHVKRVIGTGVYMELPPGYVGLVCSRSGLAAKQGLFVLNAPGIIDADYRGEIKVIMGYLPIDSAWPSYDPVMIRRGERIAQLMVLALPTLGAQQVHELSSTERGAGGLGSTGR